MQELGLTVKDTASQEQMGAPEISKEQALQDFLLDIDCLNTLSKWTSRFNVFDVLRIARTEIRHSNMLAWLLDPSENHGLNDQVLKGMLRYVVRSADEGQPVFRVLTMDLDDFTILREWRNIDIVAVSPKQKFVLCIENKIDAGEHGKQLENYAIAIEEEFPSTQDYDKRFIYLTPNGADSSMPELWKPMGYTEVLSILEPVIDNAPLADGARMLINDYLEIIRRDIVEDQELSDICKNIYEKHRVALDLIFDNRPDKAYNLAEVFRKWAKEKADAGDIEFDPKHSNKSYTRFRTPFMSQLFPDEPDTVSGWGVPNHYFWEIYQDRGESFRLMLSFSSKNISPDQKALVEEIVSICERDKIKNRNAQKLNPNWEWRTQFSVKSAKVGVDIDEKAVFDKLNGMLKEAFAFEGDLKSALPASES